MQKKNIILLAIGGVVALLVLVLFVLCMFFEICFFNFGSDKVETIIEVPVEDSIQVEKPIKKFSPSPIYFRYGSAAYKDLFVAQDKAKEVADFLLNEEPYKNVTLVGYTCDVGIEKDNLDLSDRRSSVVKSMLISYGVAPTRINIQPLGEESYIESTSEDKSEYRKVEVSIN